MRKNDWKIRNSLKYKIKMWFYRLTFRDIAHVMKEIFNFTFEIVIAILGFIFIFIIPALLH